MLNKRKLNKLREEVEYDETKWRLEKELLLRKKALKEEQEQLKKKKKTSTSKLLIIFLFLNCSIIELFTGWATMKMLVISMETGLAIDFTPLVALIGAVVGEVIGYGIYSIKATKENTVGGITYMTALKQEENIIE